MDLLCRLCDRSIIDNEFEYKKYLTSLRKENDKSFIKNILLIISIWMMLIKY